MRSNMTVMELIFCNITLIQNYAKYTIPGIFFEVEHFKKCKYINTAC